MLALAPEALWPMLPSNQLGNVCELDCCEYLLSSTICIFCVAACQEIRKSVHWGNHLAVGHAVQDVYCEYCSAAMKLASASVIVNRCRKWCASFAYQPSVLRDWLHASGMCSSP